MKTIDPQTLAAKGMTVSDLIRELQDFPPEALVMFVCDYGDYHHTQQALPVASIELIDPDSRVVESSYSHSGMAVEETEGAEEHPEQPDVVLLSMTN